MPLFTKKPKDKKPIKERLKGSVGRYTQPLRDGASIITEAAGSISSKLKQKPERDLQLESEMRASFPIMLVSWGMTTADIPMVMRGLKIEAICWSAAAAAMFVWACYCAFNDNIIDVGIALIGCCAGAGIASTRWWRLAVLRQQRFTPYTEWLGIKHSKENS